MDLARILLATDFSANSRAAIAPAIAFAKTFEVAVDLLYVVEPPTSGTVEWRLVGPEGKDVDARELLRDLAYRDLERFAQELRSAGVTVNCRIEEGSAWRVIAKIADRDLYDLVVLSTHGHTGVKRLLMGSVAEQVMRHATCPVMVVHPAEAS